MNQELGIMQKNKKFKTILHNSRLAPASTQGAAKRAYFIIRKAKGFTLIELLAAIIVLMAVGTILGITLFSALRGANKTNTISQVRQNGYYAITQMTKTLRGSKSLNSPFPCAPVPQDYSSIEITTVDGIDIKFECVDSTIKQNNESILNQEAVSATMCSFYCSQQVSTDSPTITISFTLSQAGTPSFFEQKASIPFETSLTLRNVGR